MEITPFYHIAAMNNWQSVVREQFRALLRGRFAGVARAVVSGNENDARCVLQIAEASGIHVTILDIVNGHDAFEFPTLRMLQKACIQGDVDNVMYFHTKGVSQPACWHRAHWRWFLNAYLLRLHFAIPELLSGHDYCGPVISSLPMRHSCGNFFAATASYIRTLPLIDDFKSTYSLLIKKDRSYFEVRHAAEMWIDCLGKGVARQIYANSDCDIARLSWWRSKPSLQRYVGNEGS